MLFRFQAVHCGVYREFLSHLSQRPAQVTRPQDIPFLPISFFKTQTVQSFPGEPALTYTSSGTTGSITSRHPVVDPGFYLDHSVRTFEGFYGPLTDWVVLCLLPSYLERGGSSLVAMAERFVRETGSPLSGFFLSETEEIKHRTALAKAEGKKVLIVGVTFALLDWAERESTDLSGCVVMETGGMKGRRKELIRSEVHEILCERFHLSEVHSEYGMTELFSQAYSKGGGRFDCPASLRLYLRDRTDPLEVGDHLSAGAICAADLANVDSCAFLATDDLARRVDGQLEILGRLDASDERGCSLLTA